MRFGHWSIGRKLAAVMGTILCLFTACSALSIYQSLSQDKLLYQMMFHVLPAERAVTAWRINVTAGVQRATAIAHSDDASLADYFAPATQAATAHTQQQLAQIQTLLTSPRDIALLAEAEALRTTYLQQRQRIAERKQAGDLAGAQQIFQQEFEPTTRAYLAKVEALETSLRDAFNAMTMVSKDTRFATIWQLIAFTGVAIGVGCVLAVVASRAIVRPLRRAKAAATEVAALDLSGAPATHYSGDEAGQLLQAIDAMRDQLNHTMAQVQAAAHSISSASTQVAEGSHELRSRTETTAANLQASAGAIDSLSQSALQCADATRQAESLSRASSSATERGFAVTQSVQATMENLHHSSQKIGDIIGVIDGLAFQTKILALNAAVEAARAGEQGRGFAVVAGEVRTLAQRSATAAKEIRALIDSNLHSVSAGHDQVLQASAAMQAISDNVVRVQDIVAQVNTANHAQSQGAVQVNTSIAQLEQMTQENTTLVEASSTAAAHLQAQAQALHRAVQHFKLRMRPA